MKSHWKKRSESKNAVRPKKSSWHLLARRKIKIAREPVEIKISNLELLALSGDDITFSVTCSKGTYIRQLGVDIAKSLGTVGHLISLLRTRVGDFFLDDAINFKDIEQSCLFTEN